MHTTTNQTTTYRADPMNLVQVDPCSDSRDLAGWTGTCQALTRGFQPIFDGALHLVAGEELDDPTDREVAWAMRATSDLR